MVLFSLSLNTVALHIDSDVLLSSHGGANRRSENPLRLQLKFGLAKKFPLDWATVLLDSIRRGIQSAVTFQLLGRKLTLIIDSRNQIAERGESARILLAFVDPNASSHLGSRLRDAQIQVPLSDTPVSVAKVIRRSESDDCQQHLG